MTNPLASALRACLNLMDRATPAPEDDQLWRDTRREASRILAQHDIRMDERSSFRAGVIAWIVILAALLLVGWWVSPACAQDGLQTRVTVHHDPAPGDDWFARLVIINRIGLYNETELLGTDHGAVAVTYTTTIPASLNDPESADQACVTDLPPGVVARPDCVTMLEATTGTIFLIRYIGG